MHWAGLDAPVEIDQGMSALEAEFTLAEYDPEVIKLFGLYDQNVNQATIRGALQRNGDTAAVSLVANFTGHIKNFDPGFEAGAMIEATFTWACVTTASASRTRTWSRSTSRT